MSMREGEVYLRFTDLLLSETVNRLERVGIKLDRDEANVLWGALFKAVIYTSSEPDTAQRIAAALDARKGSSASAMQG